VFDEHGIQGDPDYPSYVIGEDGVRTKQILIFFNIPFK
jgi:hypothetical protein